MRSPTQVVLGFLLCAGLASCGGASSSLTRDEADLLAAMNAARQQLSLPELTVLPHLLCAARRHALDVGTVLACTHAGTDGSSPGDRARDCGGGWSGEIVACGQGSAASAVRAWLGSAGHRAILTDPANLHVGMAMHNRYWVGIFAH